MPTASIINVVDQSLWDQGYQGFRFRVCDDGVIPDVERVLRELGVTFPAGASCFEVGCYPCQHLARLCLTYGLQANGVDATAAPFPPMLEWLDSLGLERGDIVNGDAFSLIDALHAEGRTFDLVCSFGFLEHFDQFLDVIDCHDKIVKPGGLLVLTTPNFRGCVQKFLHWAVDDVNYARHVIASMDPSLWASRLADRYDILFQDYVGGFDFWFGDQRHTLPQKVLLRVVRATQPLWKFVRKNQQSYSPYCLLVARKREGR